ncbi:unnamed protein product [Cyclocybe aegerita]|uniref:BHLH domain-containing protein n=1 Tax=Cyclocybe aegerita TaxID=1973307 RepID=A0A8S0VW52_CYCAE|nr:unnamed protein product [Cyclocybe aegerita]
MSSQMLSMDYEHTKNAFDPYNDTFAYMENDFLYPSNSPTGLSVPIGLPQTMSPMDITSSMNEYTYGSSFVPANRPAARAALKRRATRSNHEDSDDDDDEEFKPGSISGNNDSSPRDSRRETVRKQRIESEQRRRDELREGYARLKETLPASNQKASKVSLLDRATSHIKYLEAVKDQLEIRLKGADHEVHRLRNVNEALMLNRAGAANMAPSFSN